MRISMSEVSDLIMNAYLANQPALWLVTEETALVHQACDKAKEDLKTERGDAPEFRYHDAISGFQIGLPKITNPEDQSHNLLNAMVYAMEDANGIKNAFAKVDGIKYNPTPFPVTKDAVLVFKDFDGNYSDSTFRQILRNVIQSGMCSTNLFRDPGDKKKPPSRGRRMLVFVTITDKQEILLPDIKPIYVSLPTEKELTPMVDGYCNQRENQFVTTKGEKGFKKIDTNDRRALVNKLLGLSSQAAEDTLALSMTRLPKQDINIVFTRIEDMVSTHVAGVPGLQYIPRSQTENVAFLPGYEPAIDYLKDCLAITPEVAQQRKVKQVAGIALASAPGCGKTTFAMSAAGILNRILLLWNIAESQDQFVGNSEQNARRVIEIARAMKAFVLLDDIDKLGMSAATGSSKNSMESGPFGRMIQMILTEMSDPTNHTVWCPTMNRITNVPPELIRKGRIDEHFFIQRPQEESRGRIFRIHVEKRGYTINDEVESKILEVAGEPTNGWTPAEIESLVIKGIRRSIAAKREDINWQYVLDTAKSTRCMADQEATASDIKEMEDACKDWVPCGNPTSVKNQSNSRTRGMRDIS